MRLLMGIDRTQKRTNTQFMLIPLLAIICILLLSVADEF